MQDIRNKMLDQIKSIFDKAAYESAMRSVQTMYWNGIPVRFDVVRIKILETESDPIKMPWYKAFEGQERQAILVHTEGNSFLIDNEDGSGWVKMVNGGGMWSPHRSFGNTEEIGFVHPMHWNKFLDHGKKGLTEKVESDYWKEHNPEGWAEHQNFLRMFQNVGRFKPITITAREEDKKPVMKLNRAQRRAKKFKK